MPADGPAPHEPPRADRSGLPPHGDPLLDTATLRPIAPRLETLVAQPWPAKRTRTARRLLVVALVVLPLLATAGTWWGVSTQEDREVVALDGADDDEHLEVDATALTMVPTLGELTMRLVLRPRGDLLDGERLSRSITLLVNDQTGRNLRIYDEGDVLDPITVVIAVEGSSARYPFDTYDGELRIGATVGSGPDAEPLEIDLALTAALDEFSMRADAQQVDSSVQVRFDLGRRWASIVWVVFFMLISWAIALSCAGVAWWVIIVNADTPFWVYALFASVLFALPGLRAGLPGNPRYGVLVDWAAFYWAIAIVAIGLVLMLVVWNVSVRALFREGIRRSQPSGPEDPTA